MHAAPHVALCTSHAARVMLPPRAHRSLLPLRSLRRRRRGLSAAARRAERAAVAENHRPAAVSRGAPLGAGVEGRSVPRVVAGRRGHRQRADAGGVRAATGAWRRSGEPDVRADGGAPRLPLHRRRRAAGFGRRGRRRPPPEPAAAAVAHRGGAGLRQRQRRCVAGLAGLGHCRNGDQRSARRTLRIIDRARVTEAVRAVGRELVRAAGPARHRPRGRRQLSARRRPAADHRADRRRPIGRVPGGREGRRSARSGVRPAGSHRVAVHRRAGSREAGPAERRHYRETSSLEAYQAFTEGRVRLESLDAAVVPAAIADFERAVALDPRYAAAQVGLGNARFFQYQMSRAHSQPDGALLARAIDHVRRAIELERDLAEAHATLAFLLVSAGRSVEALAAARRATALEPGYWGNQFRLAHAAWGEERLQAVGTGHRALSRFSVLAFRGRHGPHRPRHPRPCRVDAARRHHRSGPSGAPQTALSGQGPALAARTGAARAGATPPKRCSNSIARSPPARGSCTPPNSR